jgi:hypothetical protein
MLHMIDDQIQAYRIAVESRTKTEVYCKTADANMKEVRACREEEQLRLDGLKSVIRMVLQDYATQQPFNPFSINGDVNQPPVQPRSRLQQFMDDDPQVRNEHGTFPPPPKSH